MTPEPIPVRWVSIRTYAQLYGVHRNTVRKWIQAGLVTVFRQQRTVRIQAQPPHEPEKAHTR